MVSPMKALIVRSFGGPEVLEVVELPCPEPGPGQVLVRVVGAGVNPIDLSTRAGRLAEAGLMAPAELVGLGWDVAGTIAAVGPGVASVRTGYPVIGLRDLLCALPGAQAEYVVLDATAVARAPRSLELVAAGALPLTGVTALRALAMAEVGAGQTLLVTGAAGGVGGHVVQLAAHRGIHVVAVARAADEARVRELGAHEVVTRTAALGVEVRRRVPGGVDAVIDAAVLGIAAHDALRGAGTFVALVRPFAPPPIRGTRVVVQEAFADGAALAEVVRLVDAGVLTVRIAETMPLVEAGRAHARLAAGGVRGRIVLVP